MAYTILPSPRARRLLPLVLVSFGVGWHTMGCRAILGIDEGSPLADFSPNGDGGGPGEGGRAREDGSSDASKSGDGHAPGAVDRTEPQWPLPVASPPPSNYEITEDTVLDKTTGLMWQRRIANQPAAVWSDAIRACPKLRLAGYDDWRLATRIEMLSFIDYGAKTDYVNPALFPDNNNYNDQWTASTYVATRKRDARWVATNGFAWYRDLTVSSDSLKFRCVRAGNISDAPQRFIVEGATVKDMRTGLVWEKALGAPQDFDQAGHRCDDMQPPGFRLPNMRELATLVDETQTEVPIWYSVFDPPPEGGRATLWSSTVRGERPTMENLVIDFVNGAKSNLGGTDKLAGVRCVR